MARLGSAYIDAADENLPIAREALRAARADLELAEQGETREPEPAKLTLVTPSGDVYVVDEERAESVRYAQMLLAATGSEDAGARPAPRLPYKG